MRILQAGTQINEMTVS
ncbi:hypothetical protein, partial [Bacillus cereus group sp. BC58]